MSEKRKPHPETCPKCPHRYSEDGCPFYMTGREGITEESPPAVAGGPVQTRLMTGCVWYEGHLFRWLAHSVAFNGRCASAMEGARNDIVSGLDKLRLGFERLGQQATAASIIQALAKPANGQAQIEKD